MQNINFLRSISGDFSWRHNFVFYPYLMHKIRVQMNGRIFLKFENFIFPYVYRHLRAFCP